MAATADVKASSIKKNIYLFVNIYTPVWLKVLDTCSINLNMKSKKKE